MRHIDAVFAASTTDCIFDLTAKQGGPAGVIGVSDGSGVEIDLDGADPSQVAAIRIWHDGTLSDEQVGILGALLGDMTPEALAAFNSDRPVRVGTRRPRRLSSLPGDVSQELTMFTSALDALQRLETPQSVKPLLHLAAIVASRQGGLDLSTPGVLSQGDLALAVLSASPTARPSVLRLLDDAAALGVVSDEFANAMRRASQDQLQPALLDADQIVLSSALSTTRMRGGAQKPAIRPTIGIDPASSLRTGVTARWISSGNIEVRVAADLDSTQKWWVRARRDSDASIVAAAPLTLTSHVFTALLLAAEVDHIVLDIVPDVNAPVLSQHVGSLAAAYEAGRRAGRLERLGRDAEAAAAWRQCANLHQLGQDPQREKMALARAASNQAQSPATMIDHLL